MPRINTDEILRTICRAKQLGYIIEVHFVSVDYPEIAKQRIAKRVEMGGHGIPDKDVELVRLSKNIPEWYRKWQEESLP